MNGNLLDLGDDTVGFFVVVPLAKAKEEVHGEQHFDEPVKIYQELVLRVAKCSVECL